MSKAFECFNRNTKPLLYMHNGHWRVSRDPAVNWKHLTREEKDNYQAAHEYRYILNLKIDDKHYRVTTV